ncbi:BTB/POZ domain-containing protein KCTD21-like isoform X1 [Stegostoma tigrinum]|uniref:BTB/POZ domain-containing protein KCTD21-like isoform X1 n=1 Tax=Stegostoma tigrinum TaxID=3053191 RepID=UPI00202B089F|nr:BTB/POZ domain-containing protein KCTD21-like isoform X1 [Stegostoma tigrinum]XP_059502751.1 BTB/POZ domain-containing protein KCTD21-like isoform X1 [Stegostoma tigrinum]XP_059502752.1 BTB/POZ domain-containing protein KCTD21-like isoform X1 [Stegostoma tigrinum]XP_059502753.1 BTB/POZ domain-containing protein KCTD21-like isoform X1 [Stegostoma tigrinum]
MSEPITLNVGGMLYTTSLMTLTRYPESMLGSLFIGDLPTSKDQQGNYFIDRDGKMFRHILNFLRTSHLDLPADFRELDLLSREADFFQIQPLLQALQTIKSPVIQIKNNAVLNIFHDSQSHNVGSYTVKLVNVQVFSTSCALLNLLNSKFYYIFKGDNLSVDSDLEDLKFIPLEWVQSGRTSLEKQYIMENWKSLYASPSHRQIQSLDMFIQQVIKIAVNGGFFLNSIPSVSSNPIILHFTQER